MSNEAQGQVLGVVTGGSLTEGVEVRLDPAVSVEEVKVGSYVTVQGESTTFFAIVTDIRLNSSSPDLSALGTDLSDPFIAKATRGVALYGSLMVSPTLVISGDEASLLEGPQPARSIPSHHSTVRAATQEDVDRVFGTEDRRHFYIGSPLDLEARLCLDLEALAQRSSGIFGKSGTGKTFLTRLLLAGILQKGAAVNLVFDMHSEYGWRGYREGGGEVKGLKQLFPTKVAVFSLDQEHSRRRGLSPDYVLEIGMEQVEPEDIFILREVLGLTDAAAQAPYKLARRLGRGWLEQFLALDRDGLGEVANELNEHDMTLQSLQRRLDVLHRLPFLVPKAGSDAVGQVLAYLQKGTHVVLEFGRYGDNLAAYVLVANMLTRRIRERYIALKEAAEGERGKEPTPLVITIEEAHRFLSPGVGSQTTFGTIAREMRKYNVTLLVVDQRPSGIDEEVMSQLATKLTCQLDNEKDMDAVLSGAPGRAALKAVLSRLESRQQALVFGHAVPMPAAFRVREYGSEGSYAELMAGERTGRGERRKVDLWE